MGASLERSVPVRGATWEDFDAVVELLADQARGANGVATVRAEFVRADWEVPSFEVGRDNWIAGDGGYAAVSAAGSLVLVASDDVTADALLERAVARAGERGLAALELRVPPGGELARRHPFALRTDVLAMARALSRSEEDPTWPEGIVVRTFAPADASALHALLDSAYSAWDRSYVPLAHDDWMRVMTGDVEFDPTLWWLAERDGVLAGCALWWSSGWLKDIAVSDGERNRRLGGSLLQLGLAEFARRGVYRVGLKVDAANPTGALALYERNGFVVEGREQIWALSL
jgi:ribosomal protein S18 acetylase RimI-like enzyme